jgi:hypothetical protein
VDDYLIANPLACARHNHEQGPLADEDDDDALDDLWLALDAVTDCYLTLLETPSPAQGVPSSLQLDGALARQVSNLIARKAAPACKYLPFHVQKTGVAMRCLAMIVRSAARFQKRLMEELFEARYEELGPVFDVVAQALAGKEAVGEAAHKAGKVASDALFLVFPKGTFS